MARLLFWSARPEVGFYFWGGTYRDNVCAMVRGLKPQADSKALPLRGRYEDKGPFYNKKIQQKQDVLF
jgi:hypothetical protein